MKGACDMLELLGIAAFSVVVAILLAGTVVAVGIARHLHELAEEDREEPNQKENDR